MKCPQCGCLLPEDSVFCQYCGTELEGNHTKEIDTEEVSPLETPAITEIVFAPLPKPSPVQEPETNITPDSTAVVPTNKVPETTGDPSVHIDDQRKTGTPIAAPEVMQQDSATGTGKQKQCKICGAIIDKETKRCANCGKKYFRAKKTIPKIIVVVLLVLSAGLNVAQYIQGKDASETLESQTAQIEELEEEVSSLKGTVTAQKSRIFAQENTIVTQEKRGDVLILFVMNLVMEISDMLRVISEQVKV